MPSCARAVSTTPTSELLMTAVQPPDCATSSLVLVTRSPCRKRRRPTPHPPTPSPSRGEGEAQCNVSLGSRTGRVRCAPHEVGGLPTPARGEGSSARHCSIGG